MISHVLRWRQVLLALTICAIVGPLPARAGEDLGITRIVILDLQVVDVEPTLARHLSSQLALSVREVLSHAEVLDQDDIRRLLEFEAERFLLGCEDESECIAEIGGALGARHLATGSVGRIGERYTIELKLFDTGHARTLRHLGERGIECPEVLLDAVAVLAAHLVNPSFPADAGLLDIAGQGRITVDGAWVGEAPIRRLRVASGNRRVVWEDAGRVGVVVTVEPFSSQRVDQSDARPLRPGEARARQPPPGARRQPPPGARRQPPPERARPPQPPPERREAQRTTAAPRPIPPAGRRPHDGPPRTPDGKVIGDLGPYFGRASFGIALQGNSERAGVMSYRLGRTLGERLSLFAINELQAGGLYNSIYLGLGAGVLLGNVLRFEPYLHLGPAYQNSLGRGAGGLGGGVGLAASLAFTRYLELGLDLGATEIPDQEEAALYILMSWGLPSGARLPTRYHRPYKVDRWFWASAIAISGCALATLLFAAGGVGDHGG